MSQRAVKILKEAAYPLVLVIALWAVWYFAAKEAGSEFIVPLPSTTLKTFFSLLARSEVYAAFGATLLRTVVSFLVSLVGAAIFALIGVAFKPVQRLLAPLVSILRTLPTMAVVLLLVIWVGHRSAPVIVALLVVMPTLYSTFVAAINGIDRDILDMARLDGAGKATLIFRFYIPLALPAIALPTAGALSLDLKLMVAAEVLASTAGSLGAMMQKASIYFETARLMALTIMTVIVGIVLEKLAYFLLSISTFSSFFDKKKEKVEPKEKRNHPITIKK